MIQLIYPERRKVSADAILTMARDVESGFNGTLAEAVELLEDQGLITVAKESER